MYLNNRDIADLVKARIGKKSQKAMAKEMGISEAYLCDFLKGRRNAGPAIRRFLGLDPAPYYKPSPRRST